MAELSRLELARRNLRLVRILVGGGSVAAFAAFVVVARAAHPGTSHPASGSPATAPATPDDRQPGGLDFGNGAIGPSQGGFGGPQASSRGS